MQVRSFRFAFVALALCLCNRATAFQTRPSPQLVSSSLVHVVPQTSGRRRLLLSPLAKYDGRDINKQQTSVVLHVTNKNDSTEERWAPLSLQDKILLPLQIIAGVYLLLLAPSDLALGQLLSGSEAMGTLPYEYAVFFSVLLLPRAYQYGAFDQPDPDETPTIGAIAAPLAFAVSLVGAHWIASYQHALMGQDFWAPEVFLPIRILATALVAASGLELGKSYDRVTEPDDLVRTGPYAVVRNPIYTSYFFFFTSTLLTLRSYMPLAVLLAVTAAYYNIRIGEEEQILEETFGQDFETYKKQVPWRVLPFLY